MDEGQFTTMYHNYYDAVLHYSRRLVAAEAAFDVVATVFLVAWRRREELPERPLGWLLATARRTAANERRGDARRSGLLERQRQSQMAVHLPEVEELVVERDHVLRCWQRLSSDDRELLALIAWDGLDLREAARVLDLLPGTAAVRLHRARRRLEQAVLEHGAPASTSGTTSKSYASHKEAR
jgi:RNA polymerase sigma-70 factor (ECF subfamily)